MTLLRFHNRTLVVTDEPMRKILDLASKAARSHLPVLLCGPSGSGKELIARYIHEKSQKSAGPFVSVNCAAIPEGLMEAELFGYERGAFTGAVASHCGKFERASGGTLLLDEVSEMPIGLQAKLLRVLQEGEIDRLGGKQPIPIQSRILATTNRDPLKLIREETFRADLFYRLNVIRIDCPPLAGRKEAIRALAEEFVRQACRSQGRPELELTSDTIARLVAYEWPGNVRELQNAVERAVLMVEGKTLGADAFADLASFGQVSAGDESTECLAQLEQKHILDVLGRTAGNRAEAAQRLGISARTLRNKLKLYGV